MKLTINVTSNPLETHIISKSKTYDVIAEIVNSNKNDRNFILHGVKWLETPDNLEDDTLITIPDDNQLKRYMPIQEISKTNENILYIGQGDFTPKSLMTQIINKNPFILFVDDSLYDEYNMYISAAKQISKLYDRYPIYKHIVTFKDGQPHLATLLDMLFKLPETAANDSIMAFSYSNGYAYTLKNLSERILERVKLDSGQDLMTQEQQVESFIQFSKLVAEETTELVTDEEIDSIKESDAYVRIVNDLTSKGFGLSETQQFNVLQSAAYLSAKEAGRNVIYNLSDMGAGKTLMTVESIFLMDMRITTNAPQTENYNELVDQAYELWLPNKNIIAPKLSIKSSWVETFGLFYDVEKNSDSDYTLSFEHDGVTYYSKLNISSFTARANAITVDDGLPEPISDKEYLIIDEIHQLVKRKVTRSKFFAKDISPASNYKSFVLSGTLSNLTTTEWYNYITFMDQPFGTSLLDNQTPKSLESAVKSENSKLQKRIAESAENLAIEQRRYFDPEALNMNQTPIATEKRQSNKLNMFNMLYASKVLELRDETRTLQDALMAKDYTIRFDDSISSTPNFELFYQLVGQSAITAQSTQIAEELFGDQQKQHNADVINAPSSLTLNDITLLRALHQITRDYNIYKSMAIATRINNAILNLNDGLANKNIYDILTKYAASNTRFLEYLATLDIKVLEKLPQSGLIAQPVLTETPKFKILQDILKSEPNETHLIVVNDADAMIKLSKALNISSLTKSQIRNPLDYQDALDEMFEKQSVVVVPQMMIKSSLDIIQANRLIQYQLNTEISDIIQTQNRINRIGQTRETKAYYIATDILQKNIIDLFLETYKNIRVAHKGIVELFVDMSSQVNVVNDYISKAMQNIETTDADADVDVDADVDANEYIPSFNDDGTMNLFDVSEIETVELEDNQEVIIEHHDNPDQMFLFSPLDIALCHQLTPTA